ncbi:PEP-CTERM sorting domain-containing protein [Aliiglaciecola sp.]|nr:PEP-CTERM sorting domain-containing protein [Aliiglaciecola sp.]
MFKKVVASIFALTFTGYVSAATTTYLDQNFNFKSSSSNRNVTGDNTITFTNSGVRVTASAWSSSGNAACTQGPECNNNLDSYDRDPYIERAQLTQYNGSGMGAINLDEGDSSPHHALDNNGSNHGWVDYDMVLFEFDTAVELTGVSAGWSSNDSDISVLGYQGTNDISNSPFAANDKWSDIVNQGWGYHVDKFNIGVNNTATISPGFESRFWLVGVYNSVFSGGTNADHNWDAIKLGQIKTRKAQPQTQIPEPTTLALMLAGVALAFRRKFAA